MDDLKQREARRRRIKAEEEAEGEREAEEETLTLGETEYCANPKPFLARAII